MYVTNDHRYVTFVRTKSSRYEKGNPKSEIEGQTMQWPK